MTCHDIVNSWQLSWIWQNINIFFKVSIAMVTLTLYTRQQKRHRCIEQSFGLCGRGRGNGIETCIISYMKRVASPGSMHDTGCLGLVHWTTQRDGMGREEGGGFRMGNICIPVFPILNPPPSSFPIPSLWVVPVYQPQASSFVHRTWTGDSFQTWYYTCFNAILPNLPTLSLSHRVRNSKIYWVWNKGSHTNFDFFLFRATP